MATQRWLELRTTQHPHPHVTMVAKNATLAPRDLSRKERARRNRRTRRVECLVLAVVQRDAFALRQNVRLERAELRIVR